MAKQDTMAKQEQTIQWPNKNRQYNGQTRTDNTMAKQEQTIQWPNKNRQYNGQTRTDNTMAKRKMTKGQTMVYKTLHKKLMIEQHDIHKRQRVNSGAP
jgi:hypothetical protein